MAQIREEIYDENGLVQVVYHEIEEPSQEDLIAEKEQQLLAVYQELQQLKNQS
jgi:murein tripeptide amidase MpaA